jgi:hypothetical protein
MTSNRQRVCLDEPANDVIRNYAYRLFLLDGCPLGHDLDYWLEATACVKAHIPESQGHRPNLQQFTAEENNR